MTSPGKRRDMDIMKLMMSNHAVEMIDESISNNGRTGFRVKFHGPKESAYEGGLWYVNVDLPVDYPYRSPSIGFMNRIYHTNIDFASGSVCLDVINQSWSPMYDLVNIFEVFLPQLLRYPNPADPLNGEAASLLLRDEKKYKTKVKEMINLHALPSAKDDNFGVRPRSRKSGVQLSSSVISSVSANSSLQSSSPNTAVKPFLASSSNNSTSGGSASSGDESTPKNVNISRNRTMDKEDDLSSLSDLEEDLAADMEL